MNIDTTALRYAARSITSWLLALLAVADIVVSTSITGWTPLAAFATTVCGGAAALVFAFRCEESRWTRKQAADRAAFESTLSEQTKASLRALGAPISGDPLLRSCPDCGGSADGHTEHRCLEPF